MSVKVSLQEVRLAEPDRIAAPRDLEFFSNRVGKTVLDVGCGYGAYSGPLSKGGLYCVGIDLSVNYLKETKLVGVEAVAMDAGHLGFRDKVFDTVLMHDVIENLEKPEQAINEAARVSRQSLLATTPASDSYFWLKERGLYLEGAIPPSHLQFYDQRSLQELLRGDFTLVNVQYGDPIILYEGLAPLCYSKLYAAARHTSVPAERRASDSESQLVGSYHEPEGLKELVCLDFNTPGLSEFSAFLEPSKLMNFLLQFYNRSPSLQTKFPEVKHGDYVNLVAWAKSTYDSSNPSCDYLSITYQLIAFSAICETVVFKFWTRLASQVNRLLPENTLRGTFRKSLVSSTRKAITSPFRFYSRLRSRKMRYSEWISRFAFTENMRHDAQQEIERFLQKPTISILMPVYNPEPKWLTEAIESVRAQIYPNWELCIADDLSADALRETIRDYARRDNRIRATFLQVHEGIAGATAQALSIASGQFVGFLDHDDKLAEDALFQVARLLNVRPELDVIYTDEDKIDEHGNRVDPFFKPDWSPDLLLSMNYAPHLAVCRKAVLLEAGSVRKGFEGAQDYDLALRVTERSNRIGHVAKPVYSWRKTRESTAASAAAKPFARDAAKKALKEAMDRRGIEAEVLDGYNQWYRIRYKLTNYPLISIIIVTHDRSDLLKACLESIRAKTSYKNYEIIVVDHRSEKRETAEYLRSLNCQVIRYEQEFNFAKINNFASEHANGTHLLFLNDDTEVVESEWLEEMVSILESRADVGIVGAKLLYKNRRIQHAGVILGCGGSAGHPFRGLPDWHDTYFGFAHLIRNCIAVTAACMMIKRQLFDRLKGFDVNLTVGGNDVDLCIRAYELGYITVYTPYSALYHLEGSTRRVFPLGDYRYFTRKWEKLLRRDPFYNANLSLESEDKLYTIDFGARQPVSA